MSMSRSEQSSTSPPCTKPWTEWKTSSTIHRPTGSNSWGRTNWAGTWRNLLCFDVRVDVHPLRNLAVVLAFFLFPDRVPPFTLLHGTSDAVVPVESSVRLSELLTSLSITVSLYLLPGVDHIEIVTDLMAPDRRYYPLVYSCIKQEHRKLLGPHWTIEWMLDLQTALQQSCLQTLRPEMFDFQSWLWMVPFSLICKLSIFNLSLRYVIQ